MKHLQNYLNMYSIVVSNTYERFVHIFSQGITLYPLVRVIRSHPVYIITKNRTISYCIFL